MKQKRGRIINNLAKNEDEFEGVILQRDYHEKQKRNHSKETDPMEAYVKNFSEAADVINVTGTDGSSPNKMMGFANALKFRMQTAVAKDQTGNAIVISIPATEVPLDVQDAS